MASANILRKVYSANDAKRFKVYYDNKPANHAEMDSRVCITLNSTGQVIRLNEAEAFDLVMDLSRALKWGHGRTRR